MMNFPQHYIVALILAVVGYLLVRNMHPRIKANQHPALEFSKEEFEDSQVMDENTFDLSGLQTGEQIVIAIETIGCFGGHREKTTIKKTGEGFIVKFASSHEGRPRSEKYFDLSFEDSLVKFQTSFINYFKPSVRGFCTTTTDFYIKREKKTWHLFDGGCSDGSGYEAFMKKMGIYPPTDVAIDQ
jgi:hypothetical protein